LIITGEKDLQFPALDFQQATKILPSAVSIQLLSIKDMCHALKLQESEPSMLTLKREYRLMATKPGLITAIKEFMSQ
jgi:hypothetical protein